MKLLESKFNNFRCFIEYPIQYGIQTTVFIGKNGTGKSSILSGIRRGLSFMFAKPKNFPKNLAISNNTKVQTFKKLEANFNTISRIYEYPIQNDFVGFFDNTQINWSILKKTMNGGLTTTLYNDALNTVLGYYNNNPIGKLPVLAVFADSFPHKKINFGTKVRKIISQDLLPRDLGYYAWDERTNCAELWLTRFYKVANYTKDLKNEIEQIDEQIIFYQNSIYRKYEQDEHQVPLWEKKIEERGNKIDDFERKIYDLIIKLNFLKNDKRNFIFNKERAFIENKILVFTKPIYDDYNFINKEFELYRIAVTRPADLKNYTLEFSFNDGRVIAFETLPMGYKRIFSLVIDLAYRCYILNEDSESEGIVLIDEIELHLHPTIQQEILQRLQKTFPKIQFIVTTHSPLVISNFKADENNKIIKLEHDGNKYWNQTLENIYGIDYTTGLMDIMGAKYRASSIDNLIDSIVILASRNRNEDAEKIKRELYAIVGEDNDHIKSEIDTRIEMNKNKSNGEFK